MSARVGSTDRAVTAYAGAELLRQTARALRVREAVAGSLSLKQRARGLAEADVVPAVSESIARGARCLDDLAVTRGDAAPEALRGFGVPAPQTAGSWLRRFTLGHIGLLNKALTEVQRNAFVAAGVLPVTLDFDSTYVFSRSKRRLGVLVLLPAFAVLAIGACGQPTAVEAGAAGDTTAGHSTATTEVPDEFGLQCKPGQNYEQLTADFVGPEGTPNAGRVDPVEVRRAHLADAEPSIRAELPDEIPDARPSRGFWRTTQRPGEQVVAYARGGRVQARYSLKDVGGEWVVAGSVSCEAVTD